VTFTAIGTGFALRSVTLRAPSSGEITELNITAGAKFKSGDVLMRLEDRDERLAVDLAEARYARAGSERDRYRALEGTGATAAARIEQAETDYEVAQIELEKARAELADRLLRAPFRGVAGLAAVESG
jgi:multidrug efflux pump subunit AcrA (membrane-fusion protein)